MKKNELIRVVICWKSHALYDIARQTTFISKEHFLKNKIVPIKLRKDQEVESISLELINLKLKAKREKS